MKKEIKNVKFYEIGPYLQYVFGYYDGPLEGLIKKDDQHYYFEIYNYEVYEDSFVLYPIELDKECEEYLKDYKKSYLHWCYEDGKKIADYDGRDLSWFAIRWEERNPLKDKVEDLKKDVNMILTKEQRKELVYDGESGEIYVEAEQEIGMDSHGCNVVLVVCKVPNVDSLMAFTYRYSSEENFFDVDPDEMIAVKEYEKTVTVYERRDGMKLGELI